MRIIPRIMFNDRDPAALNGYMRYCSRRGAAIDPRARRWQGQAAVMDGGGLPAPSPVASQGTSANFTGSPAAPLFRPAPPDALRHAPPPAPGCSPACRSAYSPRSHGPASPGSTLSPPRSPASASPSRGGTGGSFPIWPAPMPGYTPRPRW